MPTASKERRRPPFTYSIPKRSLDRVVREFDLDGFDEWVFHGTCTCEPDYAAQIIHENRVDFYWESSGHLFLKWKGDLRHRREALSLWEDLFTEESNGRAALCIETSDEESFSEDMEEESDDCMSD